MPATRPFRPCPRVGARCPLRRSPAVLSTVLFGSQPVYSVDSRARQMRPSRPSLTRSFVPVLDPVDPLLDPGHPTRSNVNASSTRSKTEPAAGNSVRVPAVLVRTRPFDIRLGLSTTCFSLRQLHPLPRSIQVTRTSVHYYSDINEPAASPQRISQISNRGSFRRTMT